MKIHLLLTSAFLILSGCEDRAAQFAKSTDALLVEYQKKVDSQLTTSTASYQRAATLIASEAGRVSLESLQIERLERATQLEADYREKRRPVSHYRDDLRAYASVDFAQLRAWVSADVDASRPYLQQLIALESDQAMIDAYDKILRSLAQPRGIRAEITDLKQFIDDSKTEFSKQVCDGIDKQLNAAPAPSDDKAKALKALQSSQNCPKN